MITPQQLDRAAGLAAGYVKSGHLPMVAYAVSDRSGLRARAAWGEGGQEQPDLCDRQYALASISKSIGSLVIARLYEQGLVDYAAPISEYVPEFGSSPVRRGITVRQIFNHSTGLPSRYVADAAQVDFDAARLLETLCSEELVDEPGTVSRYSSWPFQLLNAMVSRLLGLTMEQALGRYVFGPCGMAHTSFYSDPQLRYPVVDYPLPAGPACAQVEGLEASGGGLWSTLDDLQALGRACLTPGQLLEGATLEYVTRPLPALPLSGNEAACSRRTRGWDRGRAGAFAHQPESGFGHGGATGTLFFLDPERSLVFVLLCNRWGSGNDHAFAMLEGLYS